MRMTLPHLSRRRRRVVTVLAATTVAALAIAVPALANNTPDNAWPYQGQQARSATLVAVGDIACEPPADGSLSSTRCQQQLATANLTENLQPDLVAIMGDEQYQTGKYSDFENSFDKSWGAFKFLQRPAPGNHEFYTKSKYLDPVTGQPEPAQNGKGYFEYYNGYTGDPTSAAGTPRPYGQAGEPSKGYYSYDLGAWHLISLNAECEKQPGGCDPNGAWLTAQTQWLKQDLAHNRADCTLAYWHQPLFTAVDPAPSVDGAATKAWWQALYNSGADVVLNGHDHVYTRWAPQTPDGTVDAHHGIRQFTIGTGGEDLDTNIAPLPANVDAANDQSYGVSRFTLNNHSYSWRFTSAIGTYTDAGTASCHGAPAHHR